jgi:hypothetical protein
MYQLPAQPEQWRSEGNAWKSFPSRELQKKILELAKVEGSTKLCPVAQMTDWILVVVQ